MRSGRCQDAPARGSGSRLEPADVDPAARRDRILRLEVDELGVVVDALQRPADQTAVEGANEVPALGQDRVLEGAGAQPHVHLAPAPRRRRGHLLRREPEAGERGRQRLRGGVGLHQAAALLPPERLHALFAEARTADELEQQFDRAWQDGNPANEQLGNQTLNLSASQGAIAEFRLDEEGTYPFVTHDFTNATKGAVGLLRTEHATGTMSH